MWTEMYAVFLFTDGRFGDLLDEYYLIKDCQVFFFHVFFV